MSKPNLFDIGTYFINTESKELFRIVDKVWIGTIGKPSRSKVLSGEVVINDWLYNVQYLTKPSTWGRYYEKRIIDICEPVVNEALVKALYE